MVRKIIFSSILGFSLAANAQNVADGERNGLLQATASIFPTVSWNNGSWTNLVGGNLAYQFDDHYSFRGDFYTCIASQKSGSIYGDLTIVQAGFFRNFTHKRFDFFIGLQVGLAGVQTTYLDMVTLSYVSSKRYYQPVIDIPLGIKFHVSNYFYFFAEAHNFFMRHPERNITLGNTSFTGGLGLQLPVRRLMKK